MEEEEEEEGRKIRNQSGVRFALPSFPPLFAGMCRSSKVDLPSSLFLRDLMGKRKEREKSLKNG